MAQLREPTAAQLSFWPAVASHLLQQLLPDTTAYELALTLLGHPQLDEFIDAAEHATAHDWDSLNNWWTADDPVEEAISFLRTEAATR